VFYESPYRLVKFLEEAGEHWGKERRVCVSRELTKMFEENFRGTVEEAHKHFTSKTVKGEIVIVVQGRTEQEDESESE
jgi:16S rRNA (cytidine1402-2'-O)-methyltransferase